MAKAILKIYPEFQSNQTPQRILQEGLASAKGTVKLACSFSVEDVVIIDMIHQLGLKAGIFAIDTGRLNEETYQVAEALTERYRIPIEWYFPKSEAVEKLLREKGPFSFYESQANRQECCRIRKVEPLGRALKGLAGWITGLRIEQSVTRAELKPIELDSLNHNIIKISPLLDWTYGQVWAYAETHRIPVNKLHRQGYPSIGCAPCTKAVKPGEDQRAGRWWWENPEQKECGLHKR